MPTRGVQRRQNLDTNGLRRRGGRKSGFQYTTAEGQKIADETTLIRIKSLSIPPAWKRVRIARGADSPLQAIGVDSKGRTQYLYHSRFRQDREEEKFQRVVEFGEALPRLRRRVLADLKGKDLNRQRVLAAIVRLIDQGFFRVGNDRSAKSEETYGLTTVLSRHVRVSGADIYFDFVGKWRKSQHRKLSDPDIAGMIGDLRRMDGDELFKFLQNGRIVDVKDRHVNEYIQSVIGEKFTAKDFRTWAGTLLCSMHLGHQGQAATKVERKRRIKTAIEFTASQLGNTPAVSRASYICPRILTEYIEGTPLPPGRKKMRGRPVALKGLSLEERALLLFLRRTIADRRKRLERRKQERGDDRRTA
ncbi:MAG: DNA topoisomerase IB [Acidobacteriota bacterium]